MHFSARSHGHLTGYYDALTGFKSRGDRNIGPLPLPKDHRPKLSCVVPFHDEHEGSFLADLSGFVGNEHRTLLRAQHQLDVDELAWPKVTVRIGNRGTQV